MEEVKRGGVAKCEAERTSSSNLRSWIMLATAFCLMHLALSIYLSAYSFLLFLCSTTRTYAMVTGRSMSR